LKTYSTKEIENLPAMVRGGAFQAIRDAVLPKIPKNQFAILSEVVKEVEVPGIKKDMKYNYFRNALKNHLVKHNGRMLVSKEEVVEEETQPEPETQE